MAKYHGTVGYITTVETVPGVWTEQVVERSYFGDVLEFGSKWQTASKVNDDLDVTNQLSIVSDPFAMQHFHAIKYVTWLGAKWKVTSVKVQYPRLILSIGGVYNGEQT